MDERVTQPARMSHVIGFIGTLLVLGAALLTLYGFLLATWASIALNAIWGLIALVAVLRVVRADERRRPAPRSEGLVRSPTAMPPYW